MPTPSPPSSLAPAAQAGDRILRSLDSEDRARLEPFFDLVTFDRGTTVVREGAGDRAMYFVLSGEATVTSGGVDLGTVRCGEHFGELGLVAGRQRAVTVVAASRLELARLSPERLGELSEADPRLGLRFLRALVDGLALRLASVTESVGLLLRERTLPRRTEVEVVVGGERRRVLTATPIGKILPEEVDGAPVVAGLVDRRPMSLTAPISSPCELLPLTVRQGEGQRVFRQSLALLLLEAAAAHDPALGVTMDHTVGFAQRVRVRGGDVDLRWLAAAVETNMRSLVEARAPLREELWTVDEARDHFAATGWSEATDLLSTWRDPAVPLVSYGEVYALQTGPFLPDAGRMGRFQIAHDDGGLLLVYGREAASRAPPRSGEAASVARQVSRHAEAMTRQQRRWLGTLGIESVGAFNRACIDGDVTGLIQVSEGFQEKRIGQIADEIGQRTAALKVVAIAGPSSSGKTTFIKRLQVQLRVNGIRPIGISLDDYYVDREETPRTPDGDYDYEAFEAMRVDLLGEHLSRLLAGETVRTARYDFLAGRSHPDGGSEITVGERDVLLMEGIHGLNPRLLEAIPADAAFRVFVCPLTQLPFDRATRVHASDVRLLRRLIRDRRHRGYDAAATIQRWPAVRAGERAHIYPFQHHADAVFDTSLIYEPSVLKVYAERYLLEVPPDDEAYPTAFRLLQLVDRFVAIYPDHVPPTSILREFIGGSGFDY